MQRLQKIDGHGDATEGGAMDGDVTRRGGWLP